MSAQQRTVVLHVVDNINQLERATATAGSLQRVFPDVRVVIVVNGPALDGLSELDTSQVPEHAQIAACAVGLERRGIDTGLLPAGIEIVPTAPEIIVREQFGGAAYIRL